MSRVRLYNLIPCRSFIFFIKLWVLKFWVIVPTRKPNKVKLESQEKKIIFLWTVKQNYLKYDFLETGKQSPHQVWYGVWSKWYYLLQSLLYWKKSQTKNHQHNQKQPNFVTHSNLTQWYKILIFTDTLELCSNIEHPLICFDTRGLLYLSIVPYMSWLLIYLTG